MHCFCMHFFVTQFCELNLIRESTFITATNEEYCQKAFGQTCLCIEISMRKKSFKSIIIALSFAVHFYYYICRLLTVSNIPRKNICHIDWSLKQSIQYIWDRIFLYVVSLRFQKIGKRKSMWNCQLCKISYLGILQNWF